MRPQGRYWLLTIPADMFTVYENLPDALQYLRGQREVGNGTGYEHWQLLAVFKKKVRLSGVKRLFGGSAHCELSRSEAADAYVWKEDTAVAGTRFELGQRAFKRNSEVDWNNVRNLAKRGEFDALPGDIHVRYFGNLLRIRSYYDQPVACVRTCRCFIGTTGTGKSKTAWEDAGPDAYSKNPRTKWWDGYTNQTNVIIDEFRGGIDISYLLRWLDRYPVTVEIKGANIPLRAERFWICSNLPVDRWYPDIDPETLDALKRRMEIINFRNFPY